MTPFKLAATLVGHEDDIKALAVISPTCVASCSRDSTLRVWERVSDSTAEPWDSTVVYQDPGLKYLNALAYDDSSQLLLTGGQSLVVDGMKALPVGPKPDLVTFRGHEANVCVLYANNGTVVSGSWDSTARVWHAATGKLEYTLKGHLASVWAAITVNGYVVTGSADKSIKLWKDGQLVKTISDAHSDAVRGLCVLGSGNSGLPLIASCSNDMSIKIWDLLGSNKPVRTFTGHTGFVYRIEALAGGSQIVSGGEDRSARVWDVATGECLQVLTLPAVSVWDVAVLPQTDDLVVGGSDRTIRVFSRAPDRWAPESERAELEEAVASTGLGRDQSEGIFDESQVKSKTVLDGPGSKEGEVVVIREEDAVGTLFAYQWTTGIWVKIGQVMSGNSSTTGDGRKVSFDGKEYDFVFDVDITEGAPPLKLPYNRSENPYTVAQKFLADNELPPSYLEDIVKFLVTNGEPISLTADTSADPYSSNRYVPGSEATPSKTFNIIPHVDYVTQTAHKADGLLSALRTVNARHQASGTASLADSDLAELESALRSQASQALLKFFLQVQQLGWPAADMLAPLDVLRVAVPGLDKPPAVLIQVVFDYLNPELPKHTLLATRVLVNLFATPAGAKLANNPQVRENSLETLAIIVEGLGSNLTPAFALTVASLLLNYAVACTTQHAGGQPVDGALFELITYLSKLHTSLSVSSEAAYRLLLTLGTVTAVAVQATPRHDTILDAVHDAGLVTWARDLPGTFAEDRVRELSAEVLSASSRD